MAKRSYNQYCGLAAALDLIGERWTILIIRDLLVGPKRFTDLLDHLPGIGTGLLSARLRELESEGIIEKKTLPRPAASVVYQLTESGQELRSVLFSLMRWGSKRLGEPDHDDVIDADNLALGLAARMNPQSVRDARGVYDLQIDERPFTLHVSENGIDVLAQQAQQPMAVITTDSATLIAINNGTCSLPAAVSQQRISATGDVKAIAALTTALMT